MSVRVRLTRVGSKKNPIWRVVVADQRSPRDGRVIESIGHYNPQTEPSTIKIDRERLQHWVDLGAKPTNTVLKLLRAPNTVEVASPVQAAVVAAPAEAEAPAAGEAPGESAPEPAAEAAPATDAEAAPTADAADGDSTSS